MQMAVSFKKCRYILNYSVRLVKKKIEKKSESIFLTRKKRRDNLNHTFMLVQGSQTKIRVHLMRYSAIRFVQTNLRYSSPHLLCMFSFNVYMYMKFLDVCFVARNKRLNFKE